MSYQVVALVQCDHEGCTRNISMLLPFGMMTPERLAVIRAEIAASHGWAYQLGHD
jgi:hypothetical protein